MKARLEFELPEEQSDFDAAARGRQIAASLYDFDQALRAKQKWSQDPVESDYAWKFRDLLREHFEGEVDQPVSIRRRMLLRVDQVLGALRDRVRKGGA